MAILRLQFLIRAFPKMSKFCSKIELENATKSGKVEVLTEEVIDRLLLEGMGISVSDLARLDGVIPGVSSCFRNS